MVSFVLDPNVLPEGIPWFEHLINKVGEKEAKKEMKGQGPIAKAGKACGISFDPERYIVNSIKSHLFVEFVKNNYGSNAANDLYDHLCQQYFEEGINLNSDKVLHRIAAEMGMDQDAVLDYVTSPDSTKKLFNELRKFKKKGILGVPYFQVSIVGYNDSRPLTFSGGQTKLNFMDTIQKMLKDYQKSLKSKK